jgi:hypothetical protein
MPVNDIDELHSLKGIERIKAEMELSDYIHKIHEENHLKLQREAIREKNREYAQDHPEMVKASRRRYYLKHKERLLKQQKRIRQVKQHANSQICPV